MRKIALLGIWATAFVGIAAAQSPDLLPNKLSGRWMFAGPSQTFINPVSVEFDGERKPGPITGRLTHRGIGCGAQDEPLTGTWDGKELRFTAILRANVNAVRMNGQCGDGKATYVLTRPPGGKDFEGEARSSFSSATVTMTLSP